MPSLYVVSRIESVAYEEAERMFERMKAEG